MILKLFKKTFKVALNISFYIYGRKSEVNLRRCSHVSFMIDKVFYQVIFFLPDKFLRINHKNKPVYKFSSKYLFNNTDYNIDNTDCFVIHRLVIKPFYR